MKNVTVTINPTEIKSLSYNNNFSIKPGEKIALNVKSEAAIKPNASNPVAALVGIKMIVTDSEGSLQLMVETITGVTLSTFIDVLLLLSMQWIFFRKGVSGQLFVCFSFVAGKEIVKST